MTEREVVEARDLARLHLRGISKSFPGQKAVDDVSLELRAGEVHALLGQNGSGKSTLIKVLSGYHEPDPGAEAWMDGVAFGVGDAATAHRLGMRFVHQDLGLIPALSAVDNIALGAGYRRKRSGSIDWRKEERLTRELLDRFGLDVDVHAPIGRLGMVERATVAIARALEGCEDGAGVLVLDEPTAALMPHEVSRLFEIVHDLRGRGKAILYVSHRMGEVFEIADRVSVLRGGRLVATRALEEIDPARLASLIVGVDDFGARPKGARRGDEDGPVVLRADGLAGRDFTDVSLVVRRGEIVGVAGLLGSGRDELPYALMGVRGRRTAGTVTAAGGQRVDSPSAARLAHVALVPADRGAEGITGQLSVREEMTLPILGRFCAGGRLRRRPEERFVDEWIDALDIRPADRDALLPALSGGNQQKVVLAKWLGTDPDVLLLAEPTAGVDVGARAAIHDILRSNAADGKGIVVFSSDLDELVLLSDRVLVFREGHLASELRGAGLTEAGILHALEGSAR